MNKIIIVHYEEDPQAIEYFKMLSQRLWNDHVNYTRNIIISTIGKLSDVEAVTARLMKNQDDIGKQLIAPYYGDGAGEAVTSLLKEHIVIAGNIIQNIADSKSTVELEAQWLQNIEFIATFLNTTDQDNWGYDDVLAVLKGHIECTLKEAVSRADKDWPSDIEAYDAASTGIIGLADCISSAIVDKFPEAFVVQYSSKTIKK